MLKFIQVLIFLATVVNVFVNASSLLSFQAFLWQGGSTHRLAVNSPYYFAHTYPSVFGKEYSRSIVLSGFDFKINTIVNYQVDVFTSGSSVDTIRFQINEDLVVLSVSFHLVLVDTRSYWVWIETGTHKMSRINSSTTSQFEQNVPIALSRKINNVADIRSVGYLKDFTLSGLSTEVALSLRLQGLTQTSIILSFYRGTTSLNLVKQSGYVVIMFNRTYSTSNSDIQRNTYVFTVNHPRSTVLSDPLAARSANFGILGIYAPSGTFDGNCIAGIPLLSLSVRQTTTVFVDMRIYPISSYFSLVADGGLNLYANTRFIFQCLIEPYYSRLTCAQNYNLLYCKECTNQFCLQCYLGTLINGVCIVVPGCVKAITIEGRQICTECDSGQFEVAAVNGECKCITGSLINGLCSDIIGCVSPYIDKIGKIRCLSCNTSLNFRIHPQNNSTCICKQYYQLNGTSCIETCGDGVLFSTDSNTCDDGNLISGDGCSDMCRVEKFYRCRSNSSLTRSQCVYMGIPIQIVLKYIEKNGDENQGIFVFTLTPQLFFLSKMDFYSSASLLCSSEYTIKQINYSKGELVVVVDYTKDMEGVDCQLNVTYDQSYTVLQNNSIAFTADSRNQKLIFMSESHIQYKKIISFIFRLLSYIVLGVFALSLGHKMIGIELVTTCQTVYFSYILHAEPSFFFGAIKSFKLVTGHHTIFYEKSYRDVAYPLTGDTELSPQLMENVIIWVGVVLLILVGIIIIVVYRCFRRNKEETIQQYDANNKDNKSLKIYYNSFVYPLSMFSVILVFVATPVDFLRQNETFGNFNPALNALCLLLSWLVLSIVVGIQFATMGNLWSDNTKTWYISLFLTKNISIGILLSLGLYFDYGYIIYALLFIVSGYFFIILIGKPYKSVFSTLVLIFNEVTSLLALSFALMKRITIFEYYTQILMLLVLEGFISILIVFAIIRIARFYMKILRNMIQQKMEGSQGLQNKQVKKIKQEKEKNAISSYQQKQRTKIAKKHRLMEGPQQKITKIQHLNPYSIYSNAKINRNPRIWNQPIERQVERRVKQQEKHEEQELTIIKERLRSNLLEKRQRNQREGKIQMR